MPQMIVLEAFICVYVKLERRVLIQAMDRGIGLDFLL